MSVGATDTWIDAVRKLDTELTENTQLLLQLAQSLDNIYRALNVRIEALENAGENK